MVWRDEGQVRLDWQVNAEQSSESSSDQETQHAKILKATKIIQIGDSELYCNCLQGQTQSELWMKVGEGLATAWFVDIDAINRIRCLLKNNGTDRL